jgi:hypothetical protein
MALSLLVESFVDVLSIIALLSNMRTLYQSLINKVVVMPSFCTHQLTISQTQSYLHATKRIKITESIHRGAIALALATEGYRVDNESTEIVLKGIEQLASFGTVRASIYSNAVCYFINY